MYQTVWPSSRPETISTLSPSDTPVTTSTGPVSSPVLASKPVYTTVLKPCSASASAGSQRTFSVVPTVSTAMAFMPSSMFSARGMVMVTVYLLLPPLFFPFGSMAVTVPVKARPGSASTVISASCPV